MPLNFEEMRAPRPMIIPVDWKGQQLDVTYDRAAFTMEVIEERYRMSIRDRMARVLIGWDLLKAGVPWQPLPKDDESWEKTIHADRILRALAVSTAERPLTDTDRAELAARPITFEERERAYTDAWNTILIQLDRDFVRAVDTAVLDDFLGVNWRAGISVNGSAPTGASAGSIGGTKT